MLMVIFGAGASHDSAPARTLGDRPPPLTAELLRYDVIAAEYPASRAVIDYLQRDEHESLEAGLAQFAVLAENSLERRRQLVAFRFYLCRAIDNATRGWLSATHGRTYYLSLFNRLLEWQEASHEPIRLVTFNYDTLIEDALSSVISDWRFENMGSYVKRPDWTLMKLHGSITWSRVGGSGQDVGALNVGRALTAATQLSDDLEIVMGNALDIERVADNLVYFPALAVPMADKTTFECPSLHVEALRSCMPEVKRLLICGWRAAESHMIHVLEGINPGYLLGMVEGSDEDVRDVRFRLDAVYSKGNPVLVEPNGMTAVAARWTENLAPLLAPWD
jgi:hypothetical protein